MVDDKIAARVERRLAEQISEFNILRGRILAVIGFSIALITFVFSYIEKIVPPFQYFIIALSLISLISIAVLITGLISDPLSRGMDADVMKEQCEVEDDGNSFWKHDVSYNLESFRDNAPILEKIRNRLNYGLLVQSIISVLFGLFIYLNNTTYDKKENHIQVYTDKEKIYTTSCQQGKN